MLSVRVVVVLSVVVVVVVVADNNTVERSRNQSSLQSSIQHLFRYLSGETDSEKEGKTGDSFTLERQFSPPQPFFRPRLPPPSHLKRPPRAQQGAPFRASRPPPSFRPQPPSQNRPHDRQVRSHQRGPRNRPPFQGHQNFRSPRFQPFLDARPQFQGRPPPQSQELIAPSEDLTPPSKPNESPPPRQPSPSFQEQPPPRAKPSPVRDSRDQPLISNSLQEQRPSLALPPPIRGSRTRPIPSNSFEDQRPPLALPPPLRDSRTRPILSNSFKDQRPPHAIPPPVRNSRAPPILSNLPPTTSFLQETEEVDVFDQSEVERERELHRQLHEQLLPQLRQQPPPSFVIPSHPDISSIPLQGHQDVLALSESFPPYNSFPPFTRISRNPTTTSPATHPPSPLLPTLLPTPLHPQTSPPAPLILPTSIPQFIPTRPPFTRLSHPVPSVTTPSPVQLLGNFQPSQPPFPPGINHPFSTRPTALPTLTPRVSRPQLTSLAPSSSQGALRVIPAPQLFPKQPSHTSIRPGPITSTRSFTSFWDAFAFRNSPPKSKEIIPRNLEPQISRSSVVAAEDRHNNKKLSSPGIDLATFVDHPHTSYHTRSRRSLPRKRIFNTSRPKAQIHKESGGTRGKKQGRPRRMRRRRQRKRPGVVEFLGQQLSEIGMTPEDGMSEVKDFGKLVQARWRRLVGGTQRGAELMGQVAGELLGAGLVAAGDMGEKLSGVITEEGRYELPASHTYTSGFRLSIPHPDRVTKHRLGLRLVVEANPYGRLIPPMGLGLDTEVLTQPVKDGQDPPPAFFEPYVDTITIHHPPPPPTRPPPQRPHHSGYNNQYLGTLECGTNEECRLIYSTLGYNNYSLLNLQLANYNNRPQSNTNFAYEGTRPYNNRPNHYNVHRQPKYPNIKNNNLPHSNLHQYNYNSNNNNYNSDYPHNIEDIKYILSDPYYPADYYSQAFNPKSDATDLAKPLSDHDQITPESAEFIILGSESENSPKSFPSRPHPNPDKLSKLLSDPHNTHGFYPDLKSPSRSILDSRNTLQAHPGLSLSSDKPILNPNNPPELHPHPYNSGNSHSQDSPSATNSLPLPDEVTIDDLLKPFEDEETLRSIWQKEEEFTIPNAISNPKEHFDKIQVLGEEEGRDRRIRGHGEEERVREWRRRGYKSEETTEGRVQQRTREGDERQAGQKINENPEEYEFGRKL